MKLSLSKLVLSVAALLCIEPTSIMAQSKRSLTDVPGVSQWLADDALTFAQSVYDTYSALQEQAPARKASFSELGLPSSCGWTCYPSDYSCYVYDFGYRSPTQYSPLAPQTKSSSSNVLATQDPHTALCGIPASVLAADEVLPCMIHNDVEAGPSEVAGWFNDAADASRDLFSIALDQCEGLAHDLADAIELGHAWLADAGDATAEATRLVIRPLEDIRPEFEAASPTLAARPQFIDYEWEVALDYFAQYGCPEIVWNDNQLDRKLIAQPEPTEEVVTIQRDAIKLWIAQTATQATVNTIARSDWYIAASDALATLQAQRDEMLAQAMQVPPVPAEEFALDHDTFVVIAKSSPASIPSLARAFMRVVRETLPGTISTAAADRILR